MELITNIVQGASSIHWLLGIVIVGVAIFAGSAAVDWFLNQKGSMTIIAVCLVAVCVIGVGYKVVNYANTPEVTNEMVAAEENADKGLALISNNIGGEDHWSTQAPEAISQTFGK